MRLAAALILALFASAAQGADPTFKTSAGDVRVETVARGLVIPGRSPSSPTAAWW